MAESWSGYRYAGISELARALRSGQSAAGDLAAEAARLVGSIGPRYNAVATVTTERAASEGAEADRRIAAGDAGVLCGIPYGLKDLFAARGAPTTWGSAVFRDRVFDTDAVVVRRLGSAGAVLAAKLAMSEFAGGGRPRQPGASYQGSGRNPWDTRRYSGGSSSGSGIAVALGLVPFALGTETGGSILGPAAFSGVTGLRPTYGLVSRRGVMTLSWTLDKVGPLARSAEDCALVMDAIARSDRRRRPDGFHGEIGALDASRRSSIRVGFSSAEFEEAAPSIRDALVGAVEVFRRLFPGFVDVEMRREPEHITRLEDIVQIEGAYEFRSLLRDPAFRMTDERQQATLESGLAANAVDYLESVRETTADARRAFDELFTRCDVVLSSSRPDVAPRLDRERAARDASKMSDLLRAAGNLAGVPGVSFPCGLSDEAMPVGLQLVGPRGSDGLLLAMAAAFQADTDHHLLRPPEPDQGERQ